MVVGVSDAIGTLGIDYESDGEATPKLGKVKLASVYHKWYMGALSCNKLWGPIWPDFTYSYLLKVIKFDTIHSSS